jgi:hypothetical protein
VPTDGETLDRRSPDLEQVGMNDLAVERAGNHDETVAGLRR